MDESAWTAEAGTISPAWRECLVAASAAPSIHNTQPWAFRQHADRVDVFVDRTRQLAALDPDGREMHISVGAAVFNLRVAIRARQRGARVELLPAYAADPDLAARVWLGEHTSESRAARALADAIARRHTNRRPFADKPLPQHIVDELTAAAAAEGACLSALDPVLRDAVLSLTRTADNQLRANPSCRTELAAWTTPGGVGRRDGVPRQAFGPRDQSSALPLRDFALGHGAPSAVVAFESDPSLVLLYTDGDTPAHWLQAGDALQRVLLTATLRGLAATPLSQIVEVPKLRTLLTDSATGEMVQTILRIGYPTAPSAPTPRRALEELLLT